MSERDDWLAWRREGIGASDVAGILGISRWASPWSVWADKAGLLPEQPEDEYMKAGRFLEAAIGPWFTHETGLHVAGEQTWCTHPLHPTHRCTVDGFVFESPQAADLDAALGIEETKITGAGKRWDPLPEYYQAQGQWQMHVTGMDRVWFAVLMGRRLDIHELARDQADIEFMVERVDEYWNRYVLTGTPPATDGSDATAAAIAAVYPKHEPGLSVEVRSDQVKEWRAAKQWAAEASAAEKEHSNAMKALLGDAELGTVDGETVLTLRSQTRRTTCKHCGHMDESEPFRVLRPKTPKEKR